MRIYAARIQITRTEQVVAWSGVPPVGAPVEVLMPAGQHPDPAGVTGFTWTQVGPRTVTDRDPVGIDPDNRGDLSVIQLRPSGVRQGIEPAILMQPDSASPLRGRDVIANLGDSLTAASSNAARTGLQQILDGFSGGGTLPADGRPLGLLILEFLTTLADNARTDRPNRMGARLVPGEWIGREPGTSWPAWVFEALGERYAWAVPPSGGATIVDDFDRANQDLTSIAPADNAGWQRDAGVARFLIESNEATQLAAAGGFFYARHISEVDGLGDSYVEHITRSVNPVSTGHNHGPMVRVPAHPTSAANGYSTSPTANSSNGNHNGWRLTEHQPSARTTIASTNQNSPAATFWRGGTPAQTLRVEAEGSTIRGKVDAVENMSATDTVHPATQRRSGLHSWNQSAASGQKLFIVGGFRAGALAATGTVRQAGFRFRSDDTQGLNVDGGWAAAKNTNAVVGADRRFRIRFELLIQGGDIENLGFKLQRSVLGGAWADVVASTSHFAAGAIMRRTNGVPSGAYANQDLTTQLISSGAFAAGHGLHGVATPTYTITSGTRTEIEFCVATHKLTDDLTHLPDGTVIEFRLVRANGTPLANYDVTPGIQILNRPGHIGGTVPEQPSQAGPYNDRNGSLYLPIEYAELNPRPVMMRSDNDGVAWEPSDAGNRPVTNDWEGVTVAPDPDGDTLHIFLRTGDNLYYHSFRMGSHPTNPNTWGVKDQLIGATGAKTNSSDAVSAVWRGGSEPLVVAYHGAGTIWLRWGSSGSWSTALDVDTVSGTLTGVRLLALPNGDVMVFYKKANNPADLRYKILTAANVLTPAQGDPGTVLTTNIAGLGNNTETHDFSKAERYLDGPVDSVHLGWMTNTPNNELGTLELRDLVAQTEQVASDARIRESSSSGQAGGGGEIFDIAADPQTLTVHAFWCDDADPTQLMTATSVDGAAWSTPTVFVDLDTEGADGHLAYTYIRARKATHSTAEVIAVIHGSSEGGTGSARYREVFLRAVGGTQHHVSAAGTSTSTGTAAARVAHRPSSAGSSISTGVAAARVAHSVTAAGVSVTAGTATAKVAHRVSASGASTSTGTATARRGVNITATGSSTSTGTGTARVAHHPGAAGASTSTSTAAARVAAHASAAATSASTSAATARVGVGAAAAATSASTGTAAARVAHHVAAAATSTSTGSANARVGAGGTSHHVSAAGTSTSTGTAAARVVHRPAAAGTSTSTGTAGAHAARRAQAAATSTSSGTATARVVHHPAAAATSTSTGTGGARLAHHPAAAGASTSTGTGTARVVHHVSAAGASMSTGTANTKALRRVAASGTSTSGGTGTARVAHHVAAAEVSVSTSAGVARLAHHVTAAATSTSTGTATVRIVPAGEIDLAGGRARWQPPGRLVAWQPPGRGVDWQPPGRAVTWRAPIRG